MGKGTGTACARAPMSLDEPDATPRSSDGLTPEEEEQLVESLVDRITIGRSTWPSWDEFRQGGYYYAKRLISKTGGVERWSKEFGLRVLGPGQRHTYSEEEIREALRHFIVAQHHQACPTAQTLTVHGRGTIA